MSAVQSRRDWHSARNIEKHTVHYLLLMKAQHLKGGQCFQ